MSRDTPPAPPAGGPPGGLGTVDGLGGLDRGAGAPASAVGRPPAPHPAWHDDVRRQAPGIDWRVDADGDLVGEEDVWDGHEACWLVWLGGDRMRLEVGAVTVESDTVDDDYGATAAALWRAVEAWCADPEED